MSDFLQDLIKATDNEFALLADDERFEDHGWIDTGSYALNALVGGSIYSGIPDTKVVGFAGAEATGKTFFTLACIKHFLDTTPNSMCAYFETENALDPDTVRSRGIDPKRLAVVPVTTVEEFRTQAAKMLDAYKDQPAKKRPRLMFALDSLGMLSTSKEINDVTSGSDKRDMTKSQLVRGAFRVLTLKMGKVQVPFLVTSHTYAVVGANVPTNELSSAGGLKYAASTILTMTKAQFKEKADGPRMGSVLTVTAKKSRYTREGLKVQVLLHATRGLDRYYGLIDIATDAGIIKKVSTKYEFPDGTKAFESAIVKNGEKYWTKELLDRIDAYVQANFKYGAGEGPAGDDDLEEASE